MEKNQKLENADCPVTHTVGIIGGKWKPILIHLIRKGVNRFGVLERGIEGINKQMLTKQLRELEADGVLHRKVFPVVPPKVEYSFTPLGESLFPIIDAMSVWGLDQFRAKETQR